MGLACLAFRPFYPRDAPIVRYGYMLYVLCSTGLSVCLSVCPVTCRCFIETVDRIELIFVIEASFYLFYITVL